PADGEAPPVDKKDPFEEIDFGSFFQDYLDPGYRSPEGEMVEKPSFENFLSEPTTLTDHLVWQLGSLNLKPGVRAAAELIVGNLNEEGYLLASDEELMAAADPSFRVPQPVKAAPEPEKSNGNGSASAEVLEEVRELIGDGASSAAAADALEASALEDPLAGEVSVEPEATFVATAVAEEPSPAQPEIAAEAAPAATVPNANAVFTLDELREAIAMVRQLDPVGVAARDLRECLLSQLEYLQREEQEQNGEVEPVLADAAVIVDSHLRQLQTKQTKEIAKAMGRSVEAVQAAWDLIKTLDPRPGLRYNKVEPRLIEPDVAVIKHGDEYIVVLNDDDVPQLRLNSSYKKLMHRDAAEKDVRNYVKERYKSAIQLIKNIEQRKQTILKVCYAIVGRQREFLDHGIDYLKPMMIKEVAEEIGVHPSTVSRAVANKYAHTPQGVFELRYFFSESVNGPEGGNTSLLILKRRVKKLIEEEDPSRPLTDEQITRILQSQGIQVTRRTVAKYREDMNIPSTHQRRVKN
ncbi:MAG TPA: RNA polymerase factor sigma-54, partial [Terriglobales bacterium]|nr:RNA polymerase factor sigma-54 [Terriglobales bacterium]